MRIFLKGLSSNIYFLLVLCISSVHAGLNHFTEIDAFANWTIEQKFDSDNDKIQCRASMNGNGTWFGEKIRIGANDQILVPLDLVDRKEEAEMHLEEVKYALKKCRSGLLYMAD